MKKINWFLLFVIFLSLLSNLQAYEIQIEKGPAMDAGPNTFFIQNRPDVPEDGESLMSWLGGAEKIERILVGSPYMNKDKIVFTQEYVQNRFKNSVCVNNHKDNWHYAPFTMGTIYFRDGSKVNFKMFLSGIDIGGNLFAIK